MNRKERTEILIKGNEELALKICGEILDKYKVEVVEEPNHGLVMIKMREWAKKSLFYMGEILVTEAKVYVEGNCGIGIVAGDKPKMAYDLAVIDGAYGANVPEIDKWDSLLLEEKENILKREELEAKKILKTKVDFSTMDVEY